MSEKCYSANEEDYKICDIDEIIQDVFDADMCLPGGIRSFFEADIVRPKASSFLSKSIIEDMQEIAYEVHGEWAEDWLEKINSDVSSKLRSELCSVIDAWAEKHELLPGFYRVKNVKQISIRMTSDNGEWEYA